MPKLVHSVTYQCGYEGCGKQFTATHIDSAIANRDAYRKAEQCEFAHRGIGAEIYQLTKLKQDREHESRRKWADEQWQAQYGKR